MLKGICLGSLPGSTFEEKLKLARAAGFDAVELGNLTDQAPVTPQMSDADVKALRPLLEATLPLHGMYAGDAWRQPLTSNDPAVRRRGLDLMYRSIEVGVLLGMSSLLIVPGTVTEEVSYDHAYARAQEALRKLAERNRGSGLVMGVENVWNKFLLTPLEMARFIDEIGAPELGAYFDVGNILAYGYPDQWIRILGHRVKRIHVKDFRGSGPAGAFIPLLAGDVPWTRVMAALREGGYDSYITAELPVFKQYPDEGVYQISRSLDTIISGRAKA